MGRSFAVLTALKERTGLRRVLLAYALNDLVEIAVWLAIILYAFAEGGAALAGVVAVVQLLPAAVLSPLLSSIGDRVSRGSALVGGYAFVAVATVLTTATLMLNLPVVWVVAASTLTTLALAVVRPFHFAALPYLARSPEELVSANALSTVAEGLALFLGPIVAGFCAEFAGPWLVFLLGSVASVLAVILCLRLSLPAPGEAPEDADRTAWRSAFEGMRVLWGDWPAVALLLVMALTFVVAGALDLLGVSFSEQVLGTGASGAGLLLGAVGVGRLLGGASITGFVLRRRLSPFALAGGLLLAAGVASVALMTMLTPAMVALAMAGVGASILMVAGRTLLQRSTDDYVLARVFAVQEATALLGLAVGATAAPILINRLSPAGAFVPLGLGAALITVVGYLLIRKLDVRAVFRPAELALLRAVPFLSALPPFDLERLAHNASWLEVEAGTVVIRQGDPGDAFYVIDSGRFAVGASTAAIPRQLAPHESFGEIALLWSIPRTVTITALTSGRLLVLDGDDFLAAVTGSVDGHAMAAEITAAHLERDRDPGLKQQAGSGALEHDGNAP